MEENRNEKKKKSFNRDSIIGLGEDSFRKNYYPELQNKIHDLEKINARNKAIIATIPDLLLLCDSSGKLSIFAESVHEGDFELSEVPRFLEIEKMLLETACKVQKEHSFLIKKFEHTINGNAYYFEARFRQTETDETLIMIRNITDEMKSMLQLKDMVSHDSLTNLYNRRSFEEKMQQLDQSEAEQLAIISIDINGLKLVNDTLGHLVGDQILVSSSHLILDIFGDAGQVFRVGGDEFAAIISNFSAKEIEKKLTLLSLQAEQYDDQINPGTISLAYGYSYHESGPVNMEYLFQTADDNMYQNKLLRKESTRGTFVKAFMKALEVKDYISEGHADRMEELALLIGEHMALHQDQLDRIVLLTKFHDIGKIGIPDSILKKPARLSDDEWKVMRTHASIGERIALESKEIRDIAPLILHHHERWDGKGYPTGLAENAIPVEDRILAIVDSFDAMTNDRPYHKAMSLEEAVEEVIRCKGSQFDPTIVDAFLAVYKKME